MMGWPWFFSSLLTTKKWWYVCGGACVRVCVHAYVCLMIVKMDNDEEHSKSSLVQNQCRTWPISILACWTIIVLVFEVHNSCFQYFLSWCRKIVKSIDDRQNQVQRKLTKPGPLKTGILGKPNTTKGPDFSLLFSLERNTLKTGSPLVRKPNIFFGPKFLKWTYF